jgi:glycosyltransferase involved in cell wall biosynthesis
MRKNSRQSVAYVFPISHRFRVPFHEELKRILNSRNIDYTYVYSDVELDGKDDTKRIEWAKPSALIHFRIFGRRLMYQAAFLKTLTCDLVILQHENGLLGNYPILFARNLLKQRVAFFGHGKNFQATNSDSLAERFKRYLATKVNWWFAYTERSAEIVSAAGFPKARITVFNNSIDVSAISYELESLPLADRRRAREEFGGSCNIGIYIGGLYEHKRIPFLIEAAKLVRAIVPDFQLLIIGGGPDFAVVQAAAASNPWIHALGPKFGREKTLLASLANVTLMPGLVGLGVLDSFAYGTPMVTTNVPYHSPEIDYLENGVNGVVVDPCDDLEAYAAAVARILLDPSWRERLVEGGRAALKSYSVENMALRFAEGVVQALHAEPN